MMKMLTLKDLRILLQILVWQKKVIVRQLMLQQKICHSVLRDQIIAQESSPLQLQVLLVKILAEVVIVALADGPRTQETVGLEDHDEIEVDLLVIG